MYFQKVTTEGIGNSREWEGRCKGGKKKIKEICEAQLEFQEWLRSMKNPFMEEILIIYGTPQCRSGFHVPILLLPMNFVICLFTRWLAIGDYV